jgi:hypothetical protein
LSKIDEPDRKAEIFLLSPQEEDLRHHLKGYLTKLLREEDIYGLQRLKTTKILQGDDNTKYFHLVKNGRHRKTKIVQLEQEGIVVGDANLNNYITEYYKGLFRPHTPTFFSMDETLRHSIPQSVGGGE